MHVSAATSTPRSLTRQDSVATAAVPTPPADWNAPDLTLPITRAFEDIGRLGLVRANRPDLSGARGSRSIDAVRRAIEARLIALRQREPGLHAAHVSTEQTRVAQCTHDVLSQWPGAEAYCGEHAELAHAHLVARGVNPEHLRLVSIGSDDEHEHVVLLYCQAMDSLSRPPKASFWTPLGLLDRGGSLDEFAKRLAEVRNCTVLIDPWSRDHKVLYLPHGEKAIRDMLIDHTLAPAGVQSKSARVEQVREITLQPPP